MAEFGPPSEVINSVYQINPDALEQIAQYLETRGLRTPVSNLVGYQKDMYVVILSGTTQTYTNTVSQLFTFQTVVSDKQKSFDGTSTVTLPTAGLYLGMATVDWGTTGAKTITLRQGVTNIIADSVFNEQFSRVMWPFVGAKGDLMTLNGLQSSGANIVGPAARLSLLLMNAY